MVTQGLNAQNALQFPAEAFRLLTQAILFLYVNPPYQKQSTPFANHCPRPATTPDGTMSACSAHTRLQRPLSDVVTQILSLERHRLRRLISVAQGLL